MLDVKKLLKKAIKRKVRVTDALIVSFLISGNLLYAEDLTVTKDEIIINENGIGYEPPSDIDIFNNYGTISGSISSGTEPLLGTGLCSNGSKVINNYGIISGFSLSQNALTGNGLYSSESKIINYGIISGSSANNNLVNTSGIGILGTDETIVENNGIITGSSEALLLKDTDNPGLSVSGNGLHLLGSSQIINYGVISGSGILNKGANKNLASGSGESGNGIYLYGDITKINNSGVVSGSYISTNQRTDQTATGRNERVGNGIHNAETITEINNDGIIKGYSYFENADKVGGTTKESANGISTLQKITKIINNGTVSGYQSVDTAPDKNGNGIYSAQGIGSMINNGVIKGSQNAIQLSSLGNSSINNYGILAGKTIIKTNTAAITSANNYNNYGTEVIIDKAGVVQNIHVGGVGPVPLNGATPVVFNGDNNGNISNGGTYNSNTYISSSKLTDKDGITINGSGVGKGALDVDNTTSIKNAIINGYETALTVNGSNKFTGTDTTFNGGGLKNDIAVIKGDAGNNTLEILGNSIINGAVDLGAGNDNLLVSNGTQINGDLDGGTGTDKLQLGDGNLNINHPLNKHDGNNDGKIDKGDYRGLAIYHEIKNFENIDVKGAVTLYETAKITGESEIKIGKDSSLNLRIDPTKTDGSGRIIGHALYTPGNKTITGEVHTGNGTINEYESKGGGTLNVITNGLGVGGVIAMSELTLPKVALLENTDTSIGATNLDSDLYVRTDSIIHSATIHTGENPVVLDTGTTPQVGDIKVTVGPDLFELISPPEPPKPPVDPEPPIDPEPPKPPVDPEPPVNKYQPRYTQLNEIYKGLIADSDNINAIYPTTSITLLKQYLDYPVLSESAINEIALGNLLTLLNEIYTASPYSFSSELSRESMGLYSDNIIDNPFKAKEKEWMIYGGLLHLNADLKDKYYYGKNYHGFDTVDKATNLKVDNKVTGAYALAEYGIDSTLSAGGILGGSKNKSDISNGSNLDGNSFYIGGYFKKDIQELRVVGGIGYQYTDYDAKRVAGNMMQSFSYDNDYSDNGLNIYLSGRYSYALGNDFYLVPKAKLSYTYIDQDSVNEGDKPLAMNIDSKSFDVFEGLIGVDLKKKFLHESGKSALKVGVAYKRILSGYEDDYLTANMKNGSDFDLLVPDKVKNNYIAGIGYEYESQKGVLFNVNGSYSFDVKENNSTKDNSRTKNSANGWSIGAGIGYKF